MKRQRCVCFFLLFAWCVWAQQQSEDELQKILGKHFYPQFLQEKKAWRQRLKAWENKTLVTSTGPIIGAGNDQMTVFLGIPFAQAPVGKRRWAPPEPVQSWTMPKVTKWWGPVCPQAPMDAYWGMFSGMSEDCLSLNIYLPSSTPTPNLLPVMVFFYGGGFAMGSSAAWYDATNNLVHGGTSGKGVIYITLNYRVATMGFLGGDALRDQTSDHSTGTWGIQDQKLALEWIQRNAKVFGGDPSRVTIYGESAGGASVSLFLTNPNTWHLFQRAIVESGPVSYWNTRSYPAANETYNEISAQAGCEGLTANASVACMRAKPWTFFTHREGKGQLGMDPRFMPCVDGVAIPMAPKAAMTAGRLAPCPVILGTNHDEGTLFNMGTPLNITRQEYLALEQQKYGSAMGSAVLKQYPPERFNNNSWQAMSRAHGDPFMTCPNREMARWLSSFSTARGNVSSFVYLYAHHNWLFKMLVPWLGVFHMTELLNVFNVRPMLLATGERDLAQLFINYWTNFAHTGDPNIPPSGSLFANSKKHRNDEEKKTVLPYWAPFTQVAPNHNSTGVDTTMVLKLNPDEKPSAVNTKDLRESDCNFWLNKTGW